MSGIRIEDMQRATIQLGNGRVLTGYRTGSRFQRTFYCLSDLLPKKINVDTYEVYIDAFRRYQQCLGRQLQKLLPRGRQACLWTPGPISASRLLDAWTISVFRAAF